MPKQTIKKFKTKTFLNSQNLKKKKKKKKVISYVLFFKNKKINAAKLKMNPRKTWGLTNRSNLGVQWI